MERYLCIHGHFYQPPRENPGLNEVEVQDSAYPAHDWNERVTAECYAPNATARIMDGNGNILDILNNYTKMSFDFGPTLLIWMERHRPDIYQKIIEADQQSVKEHHGHGNAMAQIYNHLIMPLATLQDKETQVIWGIKDFEYRYGRFPEGMWLSETAVDYETLEVLAQNGIRYTILSPYQAYRIRPMGKGNWQEATGARLDPSHPYRCYLDSGKYVDIFFYDGPISFSIAFEDCLSNGEALIRKVMGGFSSSKTAPQIITAATDGESYGHHRKFGEMALSYAFSKLQSTGDIRLTNLGEFLEFNPPQWEVEIRDETAWSCAHGVGRWKEDCGCRLDHREGWNQKWRKHLREGLDWLKAALDDLFEQEAGKVFKDPWKARNDYIHFVLARSKENLDRFFRGHDLKLGGPDAARMIKLFEIQRNGLLMFTSCGWFFDDISGIEAVQILCYADRAIQLALDFGRDLEPGLMEYLAKAKSNFPEYGTGVQIYEEMVKPSRVDFHRAMAHWAISGLSEDYPKEGSLYSYRYDCLDYQRENHGEASLSIGRVLMTSKLTQESQEMVFCLLHSGGPDFHCLTKSAIEFKTFERSKKDLVETFKHGFLTEVLTLAHRDFGEAYWTLRDLFLDERRKILSMVTEGNLDHLETVMREFYESNHAVIQHLMDEDIPLPKGFNLLLEYLWNRDLQRTVQNFSPVHSFEKIKSILEDAEACNLTLDLSPVQAALELELKERFQEGDFKHCLKLLQFSNELSLKIPYWEVQNHFYDLMRHGANSLAKEAVQDLHELGLAMGFDAKFLS